MNANSIAFPGKSTYFANQRGQHLAVVERLWDMKRGEAIDESKTRGPIDCGGDAR